MANKFALGQLENLSFFKQITYWAPQIVQVQSTVLPSIFLRAQPCIHYRGTVQQFVFFELCSLFISFFRCTFGVRRKIGQVHENRRGNSLFLWIFHNSQRNSCLFQKRGCYFLVRDIEEYSKNPCGEVICSLCQYWFLISVKEVQLLATRKVK